MVAALPADEHAFPVFWMDYLGQFQAFFWGREREREYLSRFSLNQRLQIIY